MQHREKFGTLIFIVLILLLVLTSFGPASGEGEDCHVCHGTDGGYTYEGLYLKSSTPRVITPGETFEHTIIIEHPGQYTANSITAQIDLSSAPNLELKGKDTVEVEQFSDGSRTITFEIRALESYQPQKIRTTVKYTADYHYDPTEYIEILDVILTIDEILLSPSAWSVDLTTGSEKSIKLTALESVKKIEVLPSSSFSKIASIKKLPPTSFSEGEIFSLELEAKAEGSGKLNIIYEDEDGNPHKITLDVVVTDNPGPLGDFWVLLGMIIGFLSWSILIVSAVVGVPLKKWKRAFNKFFGSAVVRKKFHCWLCYILIFLALFHAIVVMTKHWQGAMYANTFIIADLANDNGLYINFGMLAWIFMVLVSVTGIFTKQFTKVLKYKGWRWTHNILTILALGFALTHGSILYYFKIT